MYDSEFWIMKEKDKTKLQTAEMIIFIIGAQEQSHSKVRLCEEMDVIQVYMK